MDSGKQIDENETTNNNEQTVTQKVTDTSDVTTTREGADKQTEVTNDVEPPSPDFSNLTTDVGDNPYIRRPPPIESPSVPPKSPHTVVGYNPRETAKYNSQPNPKPNADHDFRRL